MLKLLQAGDLYLDAPFSYLNWEKRQQRNAERETAFLRLVELALEEKVQAVLLLGSLFANQFVGEKTVKLVQDKLELLQESGIEILFLPEKSKEINPLYTKLCNERKIHYFTGCNWHHLLLSDYDLHFYGCHEKDSFRNRTLGKLRIKEKNGWHIGLYMGSLSLIELEKTNLDYLALGNYAHYLCKDTGVKCGYPGSLEGYQFQPLEQGYAFLLQLHNKQVEIIPKKIGVKEALEVHFDSPENKEELCEKIKRLANRNVLLQIVLTGKCYAFFDIEAIKQEFMDEFYLLEIVDKREKRFTVEDDGLQIQQIFSDLIGEKMHQKIAQTEKNRLQQSWAMGMQALSRGEKNC